MEKIFWLVEYLASFLEVFLCIYFCGTFLLQKEESVTKKAIGLSFMGAGLIILLNRITLFSYISGVMVLLLYMVVQWLCYRRQFILSIGLVSAYLVIVVVIDFIVIYFVTIVMNMEMTHILTEQSVMRLICILLSKSICVIVIVTLKKILILKRTIPPLYIVIMAVCFTFLLLSNIALIHVELDVSNDDISRFTIIFFIASLGIEMIVFFLMAKIGEGYEQKQNILLMEMHNKMLQKSLEETKQNFDLWKQSIHDYKNHMIILKQMAEEGRIEELQSYLEKENELMKKNMFYIKTGNSVADTIINMKRNIAEKHNILWFVHANLSENMQMHDMDIANILGNLLDNAIEASIKEEEPYIDIVIKQEKNFFLLNIKNKYTKISKKGLEETSKQDVVFHGIGLQSVKKIVKKYHGEINMEQENQEYIVNIMIPNTISEKMSAR